MKKNTTFAPKRVKLLKVNLNILPIKGAMCNFWEDSLTEMHYNKHNHVFKGV